VLPRGGGAHACLRVRSQRNPVRAHPPRRRRRRAAAAAAAVPGAAQDRARGRRGTRLPSCTPWHRRRSSTETSSPPTFF
jgi:hypothetical protein